MNERPIPLNLLCIVCAASLAACATPPVPHAPRPSHEAPPAAAGPVSGTQAARNAAPTTAEPNASPAAPAMANAAHEPARSEDDVYFVQGSAAISAAGRETLGEVSRKLKSDYRLMVLLIGHANESGSNEYCVAVAAKRTSAVKAELLKLGVPARQIRRRARGCEPLADDACALADCDRSRRRVELHLLEPEQPRLWHPRSKP